jgi:aminoglycoside phosphotransferase (APT) family kinase protein
VSLVDGTKPVRRGEELDVEALRRYLAEPFAKETGARLGELAVEQFPSGHSNLTYLLRATRVDGGEPVELVLRRPPFGNKVKSAHDMGREFRILSRLSAPEGGLAPYDKAPRPILHCEDEGVLGAPFYVMRRIRGTILRRKSFEDPRLDEATVRAMSSAFVEALVELHALPWEAMGLGEIGKPDGYVERQVRGWTQRYADAKTDDIPEVEEAARWLAANLPVSPAPTLIHNDFKYDNLVLDPDDLGKVRGVLDWEMSTVGDPLMDLGTALGYWVEASDPEPIKAFAFGPTFVPGSPTRRELAEAYGERTGRDLSNLVFYYVFALFKTAVVAQQIYARFKKGLTEDARFAAMILGVRLLSESAVRSIASRSI